MKMNNYPDYSSPTSNDLFPAYSRKNITKSSAYESQLQQRRLLNSDEDLYRQSSFTNRLRSLDAFSSNQNSHLSGVQHGSFNEDSYIYRHSNRERHVFQGEQDIGSSQRYPDAERSYQYPFSSHRNLREDLLRNDQRSPFSSYSNLRENLFRNGQTHPEDNTGDSYSFANRSQSQTYQDYSRPSFSGERDFESISKDSRSQFLAQNIPKSNNMSSLSKGEEILKEIKILQQQQKLQELLNVSLSIAKQMKHSPVPRDVDRESLSNNNSSSMPEPNLLFSDQGVSQPSFQNYTQIPFKSDSEKGGEIIPSCSKSPSFDNLWDESNNNIPLNKSGERELSSVDEQKCLSFSNFPSKLIAEKEIASSNVTSEVDMQVTLDSFDTKVLHETFDVSSMNNTISEDNSSASEWSKSHSIPFLAEIADTSSAINELGLSPLSQNVEQSLKSPSNQIPTNSTENKEIVKSNLEDALETLRIMDPVVGLDFIIENKNSVAVDGSFSFQCKLCNSSITRSLIIDHILGTKHRMRFVKTKDEGLYNHIMSPLVKQTDKEGEIYKAAHQMEKKYGRGRVVVQDKVPANVTKSAPGIKIMFKKFEDHSRPAAFELYNENDLEEGKTRGDASIKNENFTSPHDIAETSSKVPMSVVEIPCLVSSPGNNKPKFSKQVSSSKSEINNISVDKELSIVASPLKQDVFLDQKVIVEPVLSSNPNLCDDPLISSSLKRSATPLDDRSYKHIKTDQKSFKTEEKVFQDSQCNDSELCKTSPFRSSLTKLLGHMSKWEISSPEEAEMVSKTVDVLLKLLLRYKLQQEAGNDNENLMKSFLSSYLEKPNKHSVSTSSSLPLEEKDDNLVMKANNSTIGNASEVSSMEIVENKDSVQTNSNPPNVSNSQEAQCLSNKETASTPGSGLQPPPFFSWTKSNTPPATTAPSSAPAPTGAMNWNSPFGSNLGYYQKQGFGGIPSMYPSYPLPMTHCASPVALPVPLAPIPPVPIVPPLPPSFAPPPPPSEPPLPPPPPAEPPLPPPPPFENRPPVPSNRLLPPLPPPLPSENRSGGPNHNVLPPLPTFIPPPPPPLS